MTTRPHKTVTETCERCGLAFQRPTGHRAHYCFDCRTQRVLENIRDQSTHSGSGYAANVRGRLLAVWQEAYALDLLAPDSPPAPPLRPPE